MPDDQGRTESERGDEEGGYVRSERSYGSFSRSIPLPDGIAAGDATASFKDGVLEVVVRTRKNGRTIEVA
ncbi:MAG: Hsp20/alpha crystallin family protein [Bacteroidetes bacterium]|nr:Hsp20/alpha crystallin family protein [Bacteroidota bacterium]